MNSSGAIAGNMIPRTHIIRFNMVRRKNEYNSGNFILYYDYNLIVQIL